MATLRAPIQAVACLFFAFMGPLSSVSIAQTKVWTYKGQFSTTATLVSFDEKNVSLELADGSIRTLLRKFFSEEDENYLLSEQYKQSDCEQWQIIESQVAKLSSGAGGVAQATLAFHNEYKHSPYAGVLCGTATLLSSNEFDKAAVILNECVRRIDEQRRVRPGIHKQTRATALNNLAVCMIKQHKGSPAAAKFVQAAEEMTPISMAIAHNGLSLTQVVDNKFALLKLDARNRTKLSVMLAGVPDSLPPGYFYATKMQRPERPDVAARSAVQGSSVRPNPFQSLAIHSSFDGRSAIASGTGWVVAPEWVLTCSKLISA
ncbi:MAG: hypothetical protein AAGD07_20130, partial [Planctomycetota bacterium]